LITEDTDLHPRVLKRNYVDVGDAKWEISTIRVIEDPENILEFFGFLRDRIDDVHWKYETMIFKIEDESRFKTTKLGASSFGYYRANESEDIVKAHDQIVSLISEGKLTPVLDTIHGLQISPNIVSAMVEAEQSGSLPDTWPKHASR